MTTRTGNEEFRAQKFARLNKLHQIGGRPLMKQMAPSSVDPLMAKMFPPLSDKKGFGERVKEPGFRVGPGGKPMFVDPDQESIKLDGGQGVSSIDDAGTGFSPMDGSGQGVTPGSDAGQGFSPLVEEVKTMKVALKGGNIPSPPVIKDSLEKIMERFGVEGMSPEMTLKSIEESKKLTEMVELAGTATYKFEFPANAINPIINTIAKATLSENGAFAVSIFTAAIDMMKHTIGMGDGGAVDGTVDDDEYENGKELVVHEEPDIFSARYDSGQAKGVYQHFTHYIMGAVLSLYLRVTGEEQPPFGELVAMFDNYEDTLDKNMADEQYVLELGKEVKETMELAEKEKELREQLTALHKEQEAEKTIPITEHEVLDDASQTPTGETFSNDDDLEDYISAPSNSVQHNETHEKYYYSHGGNRGRDDKRGQRFLRYEEGHDFYTTVYLMDNGRLGKDTTRVPFLVDSMKKVFRHWDGQKPSLPVIQENNPEMEIGGMFHNIPLPPMA